MFENYFGGGNAGYGGGSGMLPDQGMWRNQYPIFGFGGGAGGGRYGLPPWGGFGYGRRNNYMLPDQEMWRNQYPADRSGITQPVYGTGRSRLPAWNKTALPFPPPRQNFDPIAFTNMRNQGQAGYPRQAWF